MKEIKFTKDHEWIKFDDKYAQTREFFMKNYSNKFKKFFSDIPNEVLNSSNVE